MARRKKSKGRHARGRFSTVHPDAAGIDVGARFHVVAVAPGRDAEPVRTFQSFTQELHRLADWLKTVGISTVAMESTGVYWVPVFEILEERGFEVLRRMETGVDDVQAHGDAAWADILLVETTVDDPAVVATLDAISEVERPATRLAACPRELALPPDLVV